jgi:hypothetical protein
MKNLKKIICVGALVTLGSTAMADVIYDNYGNYNTNAFSVANGQEIGNQISFSPNLWSLTGFNIEYYTGNFALSPSVGIDVRFYYNNGTPSNGFPTPGTMFYDSGWFLGGLLGNGFNVVSYNSSDLYSGAQPGSLNLPFGFLMPGNFTFTVTFTNLNQFNLVELPLANNTAGISLGDYWLNNGAGNWSLQTNVSSAANLVVDFAGTVPEPSTFGLAAIGGALLLGINKLRRKL